MILFFSLNQSRYPIPSVSSNLLSVPVADIVLAADGHPRHHVQVKVAGVVDGDAPGLEPELVSVILVTRQRPVDLENVVFRSPTGVGVHHDLDVGVVLVVVVHRLDEGTQGIGTLPLHPLVPSSSFP